MSIFSDYYHKDLKIFIERFTPKSDYIFLPNSLAHIDDVQNYIEKIKKNCPTKKRVVVISFNFLWKPLLDIAGALGLREKDDRGPNWLSQQDITNLFVLEGFGEIKRGKRLLFPLNLGFLSEIINNFLGQLPIINNFCLTCYQIFRIIPQPKRYSVSLIIPTRNEEGNIRGILSKIPHLGTKTEIIFVEGNSQDNTF